MKFCIIVSIEDILIKLKTLACKNVFVNDFLIMGRIQSCEFLHIFTYTDDGLFLAR